MNPSNLIKMANQIGSFFEAMPDRELAVKDVAAHIRNTWEPRMRAALFLHVGQFGDAELKSIVREALLLLKDCSTHQRQYGVNSKLTEL